MPTGSPTSPRAPPTCGGIFDYAGKKERLDEVSRQLEDPKIWDDAKHAQELGREKKGLESVVLTLESIDGGLTDAKELFEMAREENDDDTLNSVAEDSARIEKDIAGLEFRRTISVDDKYLFTAKDEVINKTANPVTLYPYALISRHNTPHTAGFYILHEGPVGVLGDNGLLEKSYKDLEEKKEFAYANTKGWLGFTDKYWAAALVPDPGTSLLKARFSGGMLGNVKTYQSDYVLDAQTIAPGATGTAQARLFAGAKEVRVVNAYEESLKLDRFDRLIDWGWFYFITKPLFLVIDWLFHLVGNFGVAILLVTVMIKLIFFPLASKSYASMAKMKAVQPQMVQLRERYKDDKAKQQQELMELYKKEKINPLAGCLPILIQIPVFFSLYKVLFVTIEMRHAPFFGWIHDLAAPDPTSLFNLFGLLPFAVPTFLHIGVWPLIMGVTMFLQMRMNPTPPDPTQAAIFTWMPVIFTFMMAGFPAGLVVYWAWNNLLSIIQQGVIMKRQGAKIELWDNLAALFKKKPSPAE